MLKLKTLTILLTLTLLLITGSIALADDGLSLSPLNLQGDTLYLPTTGQFAVGVGYTIATFKDALELRAETAYIAAGATEGEKRTFLGAGIGLNVKKAVEKMGGVWGLNSISPTVGVLGLYDATSVKKVIPAVYISLIKVDF